MFSYYLPRWQEENIKLALASRRVLELAGPRQCGKTTLSKKLSVPDTIYRTLDDVTLLDSALNDPHGFVQHGNQLMIIDEIQRAPILLQAIKLDVDENQNPGRFLITGSANIQSLPGVIESLAGRIRKIRLRPLATGEIRQTKPVFIKEIFNGVIDRLNAFESSNFGKDDYLIEAFRGGYPEALNIGNEKERQKWYSDYIGSLIERDLKDIAHIKRKDSMLKLIQVLAAWSSKFIDITAIGTNLMLTRPTIDSYMNALETLYLIERVSPWRKTDYDRAGKRDKLFMTDTGLMAAILKWRLDKVRLDGSLNGKLLETFAFNQITACIEASDETYELSHYRDREQREIDFLIENEAGNVIAIEIKAGSLVNRDSFRHMKWFKEHILKNEQFTGIVLYTGAHIVPFGDGFWAVPMHYLWGLS